MQFFNGISHEGGVLRAINVFFKIFFCKNHLQSFPDCQNVFCTQFGLYIIHSESSHLYQKKFLTLLLKVLLLKVFILATTTFTGNNETLRVVLEHSEDGNFKQEANSTLNMNNCIFCKWQIVANSVIQTARRCQLI